MNPKDPKIKKLSKLIDDRVKSVTQEIKAAAEKVGIDVEVNIVINLKPLNSGESDGSK